MEIVQEIFVTVSVAILLSFLVAKLVSIAVGGDGGLQAELKSGDTIGTEVSAMEEMRFGERLCAGVFESETSVVEFVEEDTNKVDEHEVEGESEVFELSETLSEKNSGEEVLVMERVGEVIVEECSELQENLLNEEESQIVELREAAATERVDEICVESATGGGGVVDQSEEISIRVVRTEEGGGDEEEGLIDSDEDDWEGIERSELENDFAAAAAFVGGGGGKKDGRLASVGSDVQMQLYGLNKIATQGPCYEPQPMALKMSARAKWNAWQRQGNMSPEMAMEQYIVLLSDRVPGWMEDNALGENKKDILKAGSPIVLDTDSSTSLHQQAHFRNERGLDLKSGSEEVDITGGSNSPYRDNE